ncbi:MAG TPA: XdhC family protein [Solirubrobacteraceae bacterium]|nr:XdhC family protein [Solirubrobacteraceae bacterium]
MIAERLANRVVALEAERVPFVQATVVRAGRPASVRAGATALVFGDGSIEGFVGGHCAEPSVRLHALRALETGDALLLRIEPGDGAHADADGAVTVHNPCLSGGTLEIFLEPHMPSPRMHVVGETPIAQALAELGRSLGYDVVAHHDAAFEPTSDDAAVVVASHGRDEEHALATALDTGVPYVGLVASRRRGEAVVAELTVADDDKARIHTPAGLDIGARTPEEIALSILAEIIAGRRPQLAPPAPTTGHEGHHHCHE